MRCNVKAKMTVRTVMGIVATLGFSFIAGFSARSLKAGVRNTPMTVVTDQQNESKIKTFTGVIAKKGDRFILTDDSSKTSYQLDDQQAAEQFAGKKVRVKGILDAVNNTIRIETIEVATA